MTSTELVQLPHPADAWRDATALALEADAQRFNDALASLAQVEEVFDFHADESAASEVRQLCGLLRERASTSNSRARELRMAQV